MENFFIKITYSHRYLMITGKLFIIISECDDQPPPTGGIIAISSQFFNLV